MDNQDADILQPKELIDAIKQSGESTAELLREQSTTLALLSGTMEMSLGINSGFFTSMLGELALQSSFASAHLGEQQLYDAAALEGAVAMNLLINTISTNIDGMAASLATLNGFGEAISNNVGKYLPMIEKVSGGSGGTLSTIFSGIAAIAGLTGPISGLSALIAPVIATFGPALAVLAGAVGLGLGLNAIVKHFIKPKSDSQTQPQNSPQKQTLSQEQAQPQEGLQAQILTPATVPNPPTGATQTIDPVQATVDPFNTGKGEDSAYNKYQGQIESNQRTAADAMREDRGDSKLIAQLSELTDVMRRVADKPADRNVKSEIVINTLKTNATLSEFKEMLNETLLRDLETVE